MDYDCGSKHCVVPENNHTPNHRGSLEILRGRGVLKVKIFKGIYELKLEFPEGWGAQTKKTFHGGSMDIFWNNTLLFK